MCTVCVFILPDVWRRWTCSAAELEFSDHTVPCRMSLILCPFYSDHTAKGNRKGTALSTGKRWSSKCLVLLRSWIQHFYIKHKISVHFVQRLFTYILHTFPQSILGNRVVMLSSFFHKCLWHISYGQTWSNSMYIPLQCSTNATTILILVQ